jgi:dTDP-glucose 4,6-dehydratase
LGKEIMSNNQEKTILVTGGCGFIGSNFLNYFVNKFPEYKVINLDKLTYAGNPEFTLGLLESNSKYTFIEGDIADKILVDKIFHDFDLDGVIHFAAESHVDNSIHSPEEFVRTNVLGTFTLLDAARKYWMDSPFKKKKNKEHARFHHISTDEVYGTLEATGYFTETTPYAPNSPYSASKASSDMLVRSYFHTYGLDVVTTNCSNNYGPCQHNEKLIPTLIRKALSGEPLPIYGDGKNIRDWLFVLDHCKAIDLVFHKSLAGETYNIGGNSEKTNLEIVSKVCEILDQLAPRSGNQKYIELLSFVKDRPGHDRRYAIDASKILRDLNFKPETSFEDGLQKTIAWYLKRFQEPF